MERQPAMRCELTITYRPPGGDPVPLVAISDPRLTAVVAGRAIRESERFADALAESDPILGEMQRLETRRLKDLLGAVLPELTAPSAAEAIV